MGGVFFSVTLSVTILAILFYLFKTKLANRYGFKVIYIISLLMGIRLLIPYSIQLPNIPIFSITIPKRLPIVWISGTLISISSDFLKYRITKRKILSDSISVTDEALIGRYERTKESLFIDTEIPLVMSEAVSSPMLLGIFKPLIILPVQNFTDSEAKMIFRHELIHFRRRDALKKLFFSFIAAIQWFNPFVRLLMREFCNSLECLCDEAVTQNSDNQYKKEYCYMLLQTGAHSNKIATANYFSTKELLKMRIDSVFKKKNQKSSGLLITASALCLAFSSSLLCSCTVETPKDVKDEMSRIEQGIENESSATQSAEDTEKGGLMPVSEVTANAQAVIDEWNSKDGIFKFDNCEIIIPQVSEFPVYKAQFESGIESPQKKYDQYKQMEKELFGENFFDEENLKIYPGTYLGVESISLEEYLKLDNGIGIIHNEKDGGFIENQISTLWYVLPYHDEMYYKNTNLIKEYRPFNCTQAELDEEWELVDGSMTVSEMIKLADESILKFDSNVDSKINYKVSRLTVYGNDEDDLHSVEIYLRTYCDTIPMARLYKNFDESDNIKYKGMSMGQSEMYLCKKDEISEMHTEDTNFALNPTGNSIDKIISLEEVLKLVKGKLSNSVVYDVESIQLGYSGNDVTDNDYYNNNNTTPIYNIVVSSTSHNISISVDALTGDMNIERREIIDRNY